MAALKPAEALGIIRACVEAGRVEVAPHFMERMAERGFYWPDVLAMLEGWTKARYDGIDLHGRARWLVEGKAADNLKAEFLALLDRDEDGHITILITVYFED